MAGRGAAQLRIDEVLQDAVEQGQVPGVVATATDATGPVYEGAFGVRSLADRTAMTRDTVFRIASMTKAITSVAAMQLVEEGKLSLDAPVPDIGEEALRAPQVLEGFDAAGRPLLRPARRPITLRHLLTHTAGFTYDWANANTQRYAQSAGLPSVTSGRLAALRQPLAFDPGDGWEYGINIDWVGRIIEATAGQPLDRLLRERLFTPLGMRDTVFLPSPEQRARQAPVHQRQADGTLVPQPLDPPPNPEFFGGGGALFSTAGDYLTFLRMLLHDGALHGIRILRPETVAAINSNQIGDLRAGWIDSQVPERAHRFDPFPGMPVRWGLAYMLTPEPGPNGRSAGSLGWAGIFNSYYWLDPARGVAGVIMTQILPFADPAVLRLFAAFERGVYALAA